MPEEFQLSHQGNREYLLNLFLDVTLGEWSSWIVNSHDSLIKEPYADHLASLVTIMAQGDQDSGNTQFYVQTIAMLSDESMRLMLVGVGKL